MNRREFIKQLSATAGSLIVTENAHSRLMTGDWVPTGTHWLTALGSSVDGEYDYYPRIEGELPFGLCGTLYRNGPGLYERNGVRKQHLLDGDGMVQAYAFSGNKVHYRNRFIQTKKFKREKKNGAFIYPTWSTKAPHWWDNFMGGVNASQAGISILFKHGRLLAFDEVGLPYALDINDLKTMGEFPILDAADNFDYKALTKTDGVSGDWTLLSIEFKNEMIIHVVVRDADGRLKTHIKHAAPRYTYFHDFFVTERYVVINLHDLDIVSWPYLLGVSSLRECMSWNGQRGNKLLVIDKSGVQKPWVASAPSSFMWHAVNSYEQDSKIIADFISYPDSNSVLGEQSLFSSILKGRLGDAPFGGRLERYRIDINERSVESEIIETEYGLGIPDINPSFSCRPYRSAYFNTAADDGLYPTGIASMDLISGERHHFDFGTSVYVDGPIFVSRVGEEYSINKPDEPGWILVTGKEHNKGDFLAIFDTEELEFGPVAKIWLDHKVPLSLHGYWRGSLPTRRAS